LTFALRARGWVVANVKSAPLALELSRPSLDFATDRRYFVRLSSPGEMLYERTPSREGAFGIDSQRLIVPLALCDFGIEALGGPCEGAESVLKTAIPLKQFSEVQVGGPGALVGGRSHCVCVSRLG